MIIMIRAYFRSINQSVSFVLSVLNMPIHSIFTNARFINLCSFTNARFMQYMWYMVSYLFDTFDFNYVLSHHSETQWFLIWYVFDNKKHHPPSQKNDTTFCPTFRCAKSEARSSYHLVYLAYAKWGLWLVVPNSVIQKSGWHQNHGKNCVMPKVTLSMLSKTVASSIEKSKSPTSFCWNSSSRRSWCAGNQQWRENPKLEVVLTDIVCQVWSSCI